MPDSKKYTSKLSNSRVLVIGGTSGIGYCVAEASLESGAEVIVSSSQEKRVQSAIAALTETYPSAKNRVSGYACDLSSPNLDSNIKELFAKCQGKLDHIVFTAGDSLATMPLAEITLEKMQKAAMVRFNAPMFVAKHSVGALNPGPASSITLSTGSISERPIPNWSVIAAYAGGAHALTRNLALDLAPVRVNLISPGPVITQLWDNLSKEEREGFVVSIISISTCPSLGRLCPPPNFRYDADSENHLGGIGGQKHHRRNREARGRG